MSDDSEALQRLRDIRRAIDELIMMLKNQGAEHSVTNIAGGRQGDKLAYSVPGAANALGLSKDYVWKLVGSGELASVKVGKRRLIRAEALRALLDKSGRRK